MKKTTKDVKSNKEVIGKVEIPVYDSIKEMAAAFKGGEADVLALANRQNASDIMNEYRAGKTRASTPIAQLNKLAKSNPELEKQIAALVAKYAAVPVAAASAAK